jgi:ABC-2 type transport system permease protein
LILAVALLAALCSLLLATVAKNFEQAVAIGAPVGLLLAMLGGCLWPLDVAPQFLQTIGHFTPHAWAMDGFVRLAAPGAGDTAALRQTGILLLFAIPLVPLTIVRMQRVLAR